MVRCLLLSVIVEFNKQMEPWILPMGIKSLFTVVSPIGATIYTVTNASHQDAVAIFKNNQMFNLFTQQRQLRVPVIMCNIFDK